MIWQALDLSKAQGRIAVREPRVTDRLEMLNELIGLRGYWDDELYKSILSRTRLLSSKRDLIAHGMWGYSKKLTEWHVQLARGMWPKNHADLMAGSRRVLPEGKPLSLDDLKSTTKQIDELIDDLKRLAGTSYETPES